MNTQTPSATPVAPQDALCCKIWLVQKNADGQKSGSWSQSSSLAQALAADAEAPVLVEMDDPTWNLAERLASGTTLEAASSAWTNDMRNLRDTWRTSRRRITLVARTESGTIEQECMAEICSRLDVSPVNLAKCNLGQMRESGVTATQRLVAAAILSVEPTMGSLAEELRAAMISADYGTLSQPVIAAALNEQSTMQAEINLLRDTLQTTLKEMESDAETVQKALRAEASAQREIDAARASVLGAQVLSDAARIVTLNREIAALKTDLGDLKASRSWRVTSPLRRIRRVV
jgi:hypothetical protein